MYYNTLLHIYSIYTYWLNICWWVFNMCCAWKYIRATTKKSSKLRWRLRNNKYIFMKNRRKCFCFFKFLSFKYWKVDIFAFFLPYCTQDEQLQNRSAWTHNHQFTHNLVVGSPWSEEIGFGSQVNRFWVWIPPGMAAF